MNLQVCTVNILGMRPAGSHLAEGRASILTGVLLSAEVKQSSWKHPTIDRDYGNSKNP